MKRLIITFLVFLVIFVAYSLSPGQGSLSPEVVKEATKFRTAPCSSWENLNQEQEINLNIKSSPWGSELSANKSFLVPDNIPYKDAEPVDGGIFAICAGNMTNCNFFINGINCGIIPYNATDSSILASFYEFSPECIEEIEGGVNSIGGHAPLGHTLEIQSLSLNIKILPANCN